MRYNPEYDPANQTKSVFSTAFTHVASGVKKGIDVIKDKVAGNDSDEENEDEGDEDDGDDFKDDGEDEKGEEQQQEEKKKMEEAKVADFNAISDYKVMPGDYQVSVHVIECRELVAKDLQGTSDPVVCCELFNTRQYSQVHHSTLSCVFDETFIFNQKNN